MLSRFSVKKPFYVLVAVIIILVLGGVSLQKSKTDLLPEMDLPFLAVITTDIGASPELVEDEVTSVLESALSTVTGVESWQSTSAENFSMIFLQFEDGTDMDSALVKVSAAINGVSSMLPDSAGTPTYMEISMDMMATMYVGVSDSEMSLAQLTDFTENTIVPALERQDGVADVAVTGSVVNEVVVQLNSYKIDLVNQGILGNVNSSIAEGRAQLDSASRQLDSAQAQLDASQAQLDEGRTQAEGAVNMLESLNANKASLQTQISIIDAQLVFNPTDPALIMQRQMLQGSLDQVQEGINQLNRNGVTGPVSTTLGLVAAQNQLDSARATIQSSRAQLQDGYSQLESALSQARSQANINPLLDINTLSQLIYAQNFEMPAGYIQDAEGTQWMVKVGDEYTDPDQLRNMVLTHIDGLGDITLNDVADVVVTNNVGESYANMNGQDALLLSVTKTSTANTGEVSSAVNDAMDRLVEDNEGLQLIKVMDQGDYISLYIWTILKSLLIGAVLAIIVLALFLRDVRPTIIVAFSIPFSVLLSIVLMYFSDLELNIMTLGAMSLSVGMLVDNSIVVMENIYRLRGRGMSAPRAAAQGARQVAGAVIASTLTTVCVFLPMVFTDGTVRELLVPFALVIGYVLISSLLVALTVVPAIASKLFKQSKAETRKSFSRIQEAYGKALSWCLKRKAPVLVLAVVLLGVSVAGVINMGVVLLPEMTSDQVMLTLEMPEEMEQETAYGVADDAVEIISNIEGIADVGAVDSGFTSGMMTSAASDMDTYSGVFIVYATIDHDIVRTNGQMKKLSSEIVDACSGLDCTVYSSDSMEGMSSMMSNGVSIEVTGTSEEDVFETSNRVIEILNGIEGYSDPTNGQEDAEVTLHLTFDKDKVARMGTAVAQIYASLAADMNNSVTSFTMNAGDGEYMQVKIDNEEYVGLVRENLMDWTFTDSAGEEHALSEVATLTEEPGLNRISRQNGTYVANVSADIDEGYNTTLLARQLQPRLDELDLPAGTRVALTGTDETINDMLRQMTELVILGFLLLYLIMVAQFGSLLSPFIIIFTVPLAFTGGLLALLLTGEQLSMMSLLGFVVLMGTVVNNGIVFVDYANQLRLGGMAKRPALVATGRTRMRPIMMTALTTILAMCAMIFSQEIGAGMQRGMALVVAGGLLYATLMTLFVVPVIYDIFSRKPLRPIDLGRDVDTDVNDAEEFIALMGPEARETYEYESARDRRRRKKMEGGAHGKKSLAKDAASAPQGDSDTADSQ